MMFGQLLGKSQELGLPVTIKCSEEIAKPNFKWQKWRHLKDAVAGHDQKAVSII
jgi:hypothetical protein